VNIKIPLLLTSALARVVLGLLFSSFAAFVSWVMFFQGSSVDQEVYYLKQSVVIGIPAGLVISLIWWNPESPKLMMFVQGFTIILISVLSPLAIVNLMSIDMGTTLVGPSTRVPVVSIGDIFKKMMLATVLAANFAGAAFFLYRSVVYKEI
jgi:hypothetical protein